MLEEAVLYLLQVAVEWTGRSKVTGVRAEWEPVGKLRTAELLVRVTNDLLNHRDMRMLLASQLRVGVLASDFGRRLAALGNHPVDQTARTRLKDELLLAARTYSVEISDDEATGIIAGALEARPRSREREFRERLFKCTGITASRDSIDDFTSVANGSARGRPRGAIKSHDQAEFLHSDMPAHPIDVRSFVEDLLARADQLVLGSVKF